MIPRSVTRTPFIRRLTVISCCKHSSDEETKIGRPKFKRALEECKKLVFSLVLSGLYFFTRVNFRAQTYPYVNSVLIEQTSHSCTMKYWKFCCSSLQSWVRVSIWSVSQFTHGKFLFPTGGGDGVGAHPAADHQVWPAGWASVPIPAALCKATQRFLSLSCLGYLESIQYLEV